MDQTDLGGFCELIATELAAAGVRPESWACGALRDNCYCIVRGEDVWKIGFFERGRFDVHDVSSSDEGAFALFTEWVTRMDRIAIKNAESTAAWMKERGLKRP